MEQEKHVGLCPSLPCEFYGDTQKPCTCAPAVVTKYQKRISGPVPDRIEVPRVDYEKPSGEALHALQLSEVDAAIDFLRSGPVVLNH